MATIELGGLPIPGNALVWRFVRASGPGGQNVNKVSSAVECRLLLDRAELDDGVRQRLERLAGSRLNARAEVVLFADSERTQARNRAVVLTRLSDLVAAARPAPKPRMATKPTRAARARRRAEKQRRSEIKRSRRQSGQPDEH